MKTNTFLIRVFSRCSHFISVMLVGALIIPKVAFSQTVYTNPAAVDLLTAGNYRALSGTTLNIAAGCTVTGNVGGVAVTNGGTVTGTTDINNGAVTTAINDLTTVKNELALRTPDATPVVELGGTTLGRGIYSSGTFGINATLTLTGTASDIFIFQMTTTLITGTACIVTMAGTALASNVYWQVGSAATIAGDFKGNILAGTYITVNNASATIDGRTLGLTAVTLGGASVLPVELTSFTAALNNNAIELNWNTATEVNNYGFEIERSKDNSDFENIGFVNGSGNSNSVKDYSFTDEQMLSGKYFYRLKQLDNDGAFEYSKVVEVDFKLLQTFELSQNYPNPFNPTTRISYSIPVDGRVQLLIYEITGELVKSLVNEYQTAGIYTIDFNAAGLSSGIYFYKITANNFLQIKKMSVIK
ncbi:MAG: ice-binding family protein [Ignavibacteria bacterium]|nr:ice-binding family protein [Ignavibacteria bacterium]